MPNENSVSDEGQGREHAERTIPEDYTVQGVRYASVSGGVRRVTQRHARAASSAAGRILISFALRLPTLQNNRQTDSVTVRNGVRVRKRKLSATAATKQAAESASRLHAPVSDLRLCSERPTMPRSAPSWCGVDVVFLGNVPSSVVI